MDDLGEEVTLELEALSITYGDAACSMSQEEAGVVKITMQLTPRGVDHDPRLAFVSARLVLEAGPQYPTTAGPTVSLNDIKGLSDSRINSMLTTLKAEALSMPGELVLGHLCELSLDLITEHNSPEGDCCFCLEPLLHAHQGTPPIACTPTSPAYTVTKLPCFHAFHSSCFSAWFKWQQNCLQQRECQLNEEYKSMAYEYLEKEGIWSEELILEGGGGAVSPSTDAAGVTSSVRIYAVRCPRCRCEVRPKDIAAALPPPRSHHLKGSTSTLHSTTERENINDTDDSEWDKAAHPLTSAVLQPEALKQLQDLQRRFAEVLKVQRACHGLVEENVAVSLVEMQAAVENNRRAVQPAENVGVVEESKNKTTSADNHRNGSSAQQQGRDRGRGSGRGGRGGGGRGQKTAGERSRRGEGRSNESSGKIEIRGSKESIRQQPSKPPPAPIPL